VAEDRSLALRPTGALAHPGQTPTHQRAVPAWTDAPLTREDCLQLMPVKVRDTAFERIGASIEWWATDLNNDGVMLVAFGTKALVVVTPATGREGKPAFKVETIHLEEATRRKAHIQETASAMPVSATPARKAPQGAGQADLTRRMASMHRFLGLLPPRAQELMQEPFMGGTDRLDTDYLIFRYGQETAAAGAVVHLWGYVTDRRVLTVCSGLGHGYRDGSGVASWDLNCWRVETAARKAVTA
jgi:hypothetical protein